MSFRLKLHASVLLVAAMFLSLFGCKPEEEKLVPELKLETEIVEAAYEGGVYSIAYTLENPIEGIVVDAESESDWISGFNFETDGIISFEVAGNDGTTVRETRVEVRYAELSPLYFTVKQDFKQTEPEKPQLSVTETEVKATAEGGRLTVHYSLKHPQDGQTVKAECAAEWISGFDYAKSGEIAFDVAVNDLEEQREAEVMLTYPGAEPASFQVIQLAAQPGKNDAFILNIYEIGTTSIDMEIVCADKEMPFIMMFATKASIEDQHLETDEALWQFDLDFFRKDAASYNENLQSTIEFYQVIGDVKGVKSGLAPGIDYVLYVYGISSKGDSAERLTDIYRKEFTTLPIETVDVDFSLDCEVNGTAVKVSVDPGSYNDAYYFDIFEGTMTEREAAANAAAAWMQTYAFMESFGYTPQMIVSEACSKGSDWKAYDLDPNKDYLAYALAINQDALPYSTAVSSAFRTGEVKQSDNVIDIVITNINSKSFDVTMTPSNNDPYLPLIIETKSIEGKDEEQILYFLSNNFDLTRTYSGEFSETVKDLSPGTNYSVIAFGVAGGKVNTGLFREDARTLEVAAGKASIELEIGHHYDLAAVAALDSSLEDYLLFGNSMIILKAKTNPEDLSSENCYYGIFSYDHFKEGELTDKLLKDMLVQAGAPSSKEKSYIINFDENLICGAIAKDEKGNFGPLWRSEVFSVSADAVSDPQEFLDWFLGGTKAPARVNVPYVDEEEPLMMELGVSASMVKHHRDLNQRSKCYMNR